MVRVYLGFALVVVGLPLLVLPKTGEGGLLRFWRALAVGGCFWAAAVYLLDVVHLFEFITLLTVVALAALLYRRLAGADWPERSSRFMALALDALDPDGREARDVLIGKRLHALTAGVRRLLATLRDPLTVATIAVLGLSFWLRLDGPLHQVAPAAPDMYTHLLWTKDMMTNQAFGGGVYPEGMHAMAAVVSAIFFLDPLNVLRFLGPLWGFLMVLGAYSVALEASGSRWAGLLAAAIFGLSTASPLPEAAWRQASALPQECSAIFFCVGAVFAIRWLRRGQRGDLLAVAVAAAMAGLVHAYGLLFLGVVVVGLALARPGRRGWELLGGSAVGAVAGLFPMLVGRLAGIPFFGFSYVLHPVVHGSGLQSWIGTALHDPFLVGAAVVATAAMVLPGPEAWVRRGLGLGLFALLVFDMLGYLSLPLVPGSARTGEFLSLWLAAAGAGVLYSGGLAVPRHKAAAAVLAAALAGPSLALWPPQVVAPGRMEPAGSAATYLRIDASFQHLDWTIVSPVEQYSEVLGRGWHVELATFVTQFTVAEAANPSFLLKNAPANAIKEPNVFIYVETRPLGLHRPLRPSDLQAPLPATGDPNAYRGENLAAIEARTQSWCQAYLKAHPGSTRIYYQTKGLVVYWIHQ